MGKLMDWNGKWFSPRPVHELSLQVKVFRWKRSRENYRVYRVENAHSNGCCAMQMFEHLHILISYAHSNGCCAIQMFEHLHILISYAPFHAISRSTTENNVRRDAVNTFSFNFPWTLSPENFYSTCKLNSWTGRLKWLYALFIDQTTNSGTKRSIWARSKPGVTQFSSW